jgi:hypothetical protein
MVYKKYPVVHDHEQARQEESKATTITVFIRELS